jgi:TetR/AcrR family transcriptional repressor of nem operon
MRYEPEHKSETRDRVLKAAARAMRADGPHKLGVAAVMASAGLTHGGFYAHFPSRDALIMATVERLFEDSRTRFAAETEGFPPLEAFGRYVDFYLSVTHRDTRSAGCPLPFLTGDAFRLAPDARAAFAAGVAGLEAKLAGLLFAVGGEAARDEAGSVLAELVGALSLARAEPDPERSLAILDRSRAALKSRFAKGPPR